MGEDVICFIQEFYGSDELPKVKETSFLALIPKLENPRELEDFWPICSSL